LLSLVESAHAGTLIQSINVNIKASIKLSFNKATPKIQTNYC
jgi:hypothetical protein